MLNWLKTYTTAIMIAIIAAAIIYVGVLRWRVSELEKDNKIKQETIELQSATIKAHEKQTESLNNREVKSQKIGANYEKARNTAKSKEGGSVGNALRYAVDADILPE